MMQKIEKVRCIIYIYTKLAIYTGLAISTNLKMCMFINLVNILTSYMQREQCATEQKESYFKRVHWKTEGQTGCIVEYIGGI